MKTITAIWQVFALAAAISLAFSNARADPISLAPTRELPPNWRPLITPQPAPQQEAQQTIFRNDRGLTTGTAATSGNQTTYRDDRGRTTGTATVDSAGTTTFRDSSGRTVGTAAAPRRW
jgi:hypothetical protein